MYTVQVDKLFEQFTRVFYRTGLWQSDDESDARKTGKKLFFTIFGASFQFFFAFLVVHAFMYDDGNDPMFLLQALALGAVLYAKCLYLIYKKDEILAFLSDHNVVHSIEEREEYDQTNKKIKKFKMFSRAYFLAVSATTVTVIVINLPIFTEGKALPLFISFSWTDSEIIYWATFLYVSLASILYAIANLITTPLWYIMLNYSIEYRLLQNKLRKLGMEKKEVKKDKNQLSIKSIPRNTYEADLVVLVKAHRNLTETIERFRSCFSKLFFGQITTSGIGICISIYNLTFMKQINVIQTEMYVLILFYVTFDIFMVMYLGNEITDASDGLSFSLYESNWIEQNESCKKCVIIMGEVLKQPQQLIIVIYPLNLETFMMIMNGAYTMLNILKNLR